jgi:fatty-acyl-CoA synthase
MSRMADTAVAPAARAELSPLAFLDRAGRVFPDRIGAVDGHRTLTYAELRAAAETVARALRGSGVRPGDRVAYLAPNTVELLIAHFAVPLAGAVLVALNTRLAPAEIEYICTHAEPQALVVDAPLCDKAAGVADALPGCELIHIGPTEAATTYEELLERDHSRELRWEPDDEHATIAINYTSGTTGRPKGVMYSHRGAALNALGEIINSGFSARTRYLWTLPMFHCNGWCTAWAVTAVAGRHVCLREVRRETIWEQIERQRVTHFNAAPTVLTMVAEAAEGRRFPEPVVVTTAGAPPSPTIIASLDALGARVVHVYGLTETYGPYATCEPQEAWDDLPAAHRARMMARQGVGMIQADRLRVVDTDMRDVPCDGQTLGEVVMRGNNVMTGYYRDEAATAEAFRGGWFHSGDLGVMHADGYVELRDRAKDVIISGGENIATIEVEHALASHPGVLEVAVVGTPDERWGERPKAFVIRRSGATVDEEQLIDHVRGLLAPFKAPRSVAFVDELPKTSTGKVQKNQLREAEWAGHELRIQG